MRSATPVALHEVCFSPIIKNISEALKGAGALEILIIAPPGGAQALCPFGDTVEQAEGERGSLAPASDFISRAEDTVIIISADMPLLSAETAGALLSRHSASGAGATVMKAAEGLPFSCGKLFCFGARHLEKLMLAAKKGSCTPELLAAGSRGLLDVFTAGQTASHELLRVADRVALAAAQAELRKRINEGFMLAGVTMLSPETVIIEEGVRIGEDTVIYPNTILRGNTVLGKNCEIGPNTTIIDSCVGDFCSLNSVLMCESQAGEGVKAGPFVNIRPGCRIADGAKIGDFVELKKADIGRGSKVNHLSYIGDAVLGEHVNIGCGAVTVNYDGAKKHPTVIGDNAFIGCNSNLVAPVNVGPGAFTAAGSTITADVPGDALAIARARQENKEGWAAKRRAQTPPKNG